MNEQEKKDLKYTICSLREKVERDILNEAIDNDTINEDQYIKHLISELRMREGELVIEHNDRVSDSIQFFVRNGYRSNLSAINRHIMEDMEKAINNSGESGSTHEIFITHAKQMKWFDSLSNIKRRKIMEKHDPNN